MCCFVSGDIINLVQKTDDGWWQGELNGAVGVFPSTYVEELWNKSYNVHLIHAVLCMKKIISEKIKYIAVLRK